MSSATAPTPFPTTSPGTLLGRAVRTVLTRLRPPRAPLTREELVELIDRRRVVERLHEQRAYDAARMGMLRG
ncbi:hypothetical protein ACPW96_15760 [Micromonospora sp. DT81.3]|uniref:hypothetical protein n=1 Tax=Actinomycetes TaxID=1760 RepID=UPI003CF5701A